MEVSQPRQSDEEIRRLAAVADSAASRLREEQQNSTNRINRRLAVAAILVSSLAAFFALWQAYEARQSVAMAERSVHIAERAYLNPVNTTLLRPIKAGSDLLTQVNWLNSGRTPATNVDTTMLLTVADSRTPETDVRAVAYASVTPNLLNSIGTVPASAYSPQTQGLVPPLNSKYADAIRSGSGRLYVFGTVTYRDTFGHTHRTEYCARYDVARGTFMHCENSYTVD